MEGMEKVKKNDKARKRPRIAVLLGERENSFWMEWKRHLEGLAGEQGMETLFFWPPASDEVRGQLYGLHEMIELDPAAIIVNPMTKDNLVPGILTACRRQIPVLDVGAKTDQDLLFPHPSCYFPVKTVDFVLQGRLGGEYILRRLQQRGTKTKKVVILEGRPGARQSQERSAGAAQVFRQDPSFEVAARVAADFQKQKAWKTTEGILQEISEIGGFFCANDQMALGAAEAVEKTGRKEEILIVGVDLIPEAREAICLGRMDASVAFSTASVARAVLEALDEILSGRPFFEGYRVESEVVDAVTLDAWVGKEG